MKKYKVTETGPGWFTAHPLSGGSIGATSAGEAKRLARRIDKGRAKRLTTA
jgi:hypothetical protein